MANKKSTPPNEIGKDAAASAMTVAKMEAIHAKYQQLLRDKLQESLIRNVDHGRTAIVDEMTEGILRTFDRQAQVFTYIERALLGETNQVVTSKYQDVLSDLKERNIQLYDAVRSVKDRVLAESERVALSELKGKVVEAVLALAAIIFPVGFAFLPEVWSSPETRVGTAAAFITAVILLVGLKFFFVRERTLEVRQLREFAEKKDAVARHLVRSSFSEVPEQVSKGE